jgi:hypothetical protein
MKINRKIEKMFIDEQILFDKEIENVFYQKETNTFEYYEFDDYFEILEAIITNTYACEFYLEHSYKYFREYLKINNSLAILGAVKDDPQIVSCIEWIKKLLLSIKDLKTNIITYHILIKDTINYQPAHSLNETVNVSVNYNMKYKNPKTSQVMFNYVIKSLFRSELCFEAIDYLLDYFFINFYEKLKLEYDDFEILDKVKLSHFNLLDDYLDFKMNYLMLVEVEE